MNGVELTVRLRTFFFCLRFALASLFSYRLRSVLTALGVGVGVSTVIAIQGIINGLDSAFDSQVASLGTGTLYLSQQPWIVLGDWWRYRNRPMISAADARHLEERMVSAKAVVPFVHARATVEIGASELREVRVIGSTQDWPQMSGILPESGRFLSLADVEAGRPAVAIGADLAAVLKKEGLGLGDRIRVAGRPLLVVGLMPSRGSMFGRSQDDYVSIPLPLFERMFGRMRSLQVGVIFDPAQLDAGEDELVGVMRARRQIEPGADNDFSINAQQMFVDFYHQLTRALFATALGLGFVTLLVGGVGIMNIMLVAVTERTNEIGVRKAIGARSGAILLQFVLEAGLISAAGGALGSGAGLLLTRLFQRLTSLDAQVSLATIFQAVGFGFLVGVVFGFLPAWRASRLSPVDALRAE